MRWCLVKNTPSQRVGFAEGHPPVKYPSSGGTCTIIPMSVSCSILTSQAKPGQILEPLKVVAYCTADNQSC